jgi:hypothetical protein
MSSTQKNAPELAVENSKAADEKLLTTYSSADVVVAQQQTSDSDAVELTPTPISPPTSASTIFVP